MWVSPPRDETDLLKRVRALSGTSVESLAARLGFQVGGDGPRTKGKVGELLERALGATGGSGAGATWDFPSLRIELKTIPVEADGTPRESTFVCAVALRDADQAEWAPSWVRAKLSRVLWIPIEIGADGGNRRIGEAHLWAPSAEQERVLAGDFEEILGLVGTGQIEAVTARIGRWLQLRPKAAHGRIRTIVPGHDGHDVSTVPRGFYLRPHFTGAILRDPLAVPDERRPAGSRVQRQGR